MIKEIDEWLIEQEYEAVRKRIDKWVQEKEEEYLAKELGIDLVKAK